jgi:hypothetical protein
MAEIGDKVSVRSKAGARLGVVKEVTGTMLRVIWESGEESRIVPAAGTMTVVGKTRAKRPAAAKGSKKAAPRPSATTPVKRTKTAAPRASKKPAAKKSAPAKRAAAKKAATKRSSKKAAAKKAPAPTKSAAKKRR